MLKRNKRKLTVDAIEQNICVTFVCVINNTQKKSLFGDDSQRNLIKIHFKFDCLKSNI